MQVSMAAVEPRCPPGVLASERKDVPKTLATWQRTLDWRAEFDVDNILAEPQNHYEVIKGAYPHAFHGRSRDGDVVLYHSLGNVNWGLLDANDVSLDCLVRHSVFTLQFLCQRLHQPGDGGQCIMVFSVCASPSPENDTSSSVPPPEAAPSETKETVATTNTTTSPPRHEDNRSLELLQAYLVLLGAYYPERVRAVFLMHLPWGASSPLWTMTTRYLDPRLRDKLRVVRSEENAALTEFVDTKDIPFDFGVRSIEGTSPPPPPPPTATPPRTSSLLGSAADELALHACAQASLAAALSSQPSAPSLRGRSHLSGSTFSSSSLSSMSQHTWPSSGVSSRSSSEGCSSAASSTEADSSLNGSLGGGGGSVSTGMNSPTTSSYTSLAASSRSNFDGKNKDTTLNGPLSRASSYSPIARRLSKAKRGSKVSFSEEPPSIGLAAGDGVGNEVEAGLPQKASARLQKRHPRAATPPPARGAQGTTGRKEESVDSHDADANDSVATVELKGLLKSDSVVIRYENEDELAVDSNSSSDRNGAKNNRKATDGKADSLKDQSSARRSGSLMVDHLAKLALDNEASNTNFAQDASTEELVRLYSLHKAFVAPSAAALEEDQLDIAIDTLDDAHPGVVATAEAEALDVSVNLSDLSRSCLDVEGGLDVGGTSGSGSAALPSMMDAPGESNSNAHGRDSSHSIGIGEGSVTAPSVHSLAISVASSFRASMSFMLEAPPLVPSDGHASHENQNKSSLNGEFKPAPRPSLVKQRKATPGRGRSVDCSPGGSRLRKLSRGTSERSESKDSARGSSRSLDRRGTGGNSSSSSAGQRSSSSSGRVAASPLRGRGAPSEDKQSAVSIVASSPSRSRSSVSSSSSSTARARNVGGSTTSSSKSRNTPQARPPSAGRPKQSRLKGSTNTSNATSVNVVTVRPPSSSKAAGSSPKVSPSSGPPSPTKTRSRANSPVKHRADGSADNFSWQSLPLVSLAAAAATAAAAVPVKASPRNARARSVSSSTLATAPPTGRQRSLSQEVSPAAPRRDALSTFPQSSGRALQGGISSSSSSSTVPLARGTNKPRPSKPRVVR